MERQKVWQSSCEGLFEARSQIVVRMQDLRMVIPLFLHWITTAPNCVSNGYLGSIPIVKKLCINCVAAIEH